MPLSTQAIEQYFQVGVFNAVVKGWYKHVDKTLVCDLQMKEQVLVVLFAMLYVLVLAFIL